MPKKFQGENTKAVVARARKAEAKAVEKAKQEQAKEDAYWADENDKHGQRKQKRKDEQEEKRQKALDRKLENQQAYEAEINKLAVSNTTKQQAAQPKITRAQIEQEKQMEEMRRKEQEKQRLLEQTKIVVPEEQLKKKKPAREEAEEDSEDEDAGLPENVNRLKIEGDVARTVDEAIQVLGGATDSKAQDKHPEKRVRAAFLAYEDMRIPQLKIEHPTLRLSQLKQLIKKEWQKSPENPMNQNVGMD